MPNQFVNPPLMEAICEFIFKSDKWDPSVAGLVYPEIKDLFPNKESVQEGTFELSLDTKTKQAPIFSHQANDLPKFSSASKNIFVIFRKNKISIHYTKPYLGWTDFSEKIKKVVAIYQKIASPDKIERVGLRYVNKISLPKTGFRLDDYFKIKPPTLNNVIKDTDINAFQLGILSNDGENTIKTQFASLVENEKNADFILDIDFFSDKKLDDLDISVWLETAHNKIETIFLKSLQEKTTSTFNIK